MGTTAQCIYIIYHVSAVSSAVEYFLVFPANGTNHKYGSIWLSQLDRWYMSSSPPRGRRVMLLDTSSRTTIVGSSRPRRRLRVPNAKGEVVAMAGGIYYPPPHSEPGCRKGTTAVKRHVSAAPRQPMETQLCGAFSCSPRVPRWFEPQPRALRGRPPLYALFSLSLSSPYPLPPPRASLSHKTALGTERVLSSIIMADAARQLKIKLGVCKR